MDLGYAEYMEKKEAEGKTPFGPTPVRRVKLHPARWRTDKALFDKVVAVAAVEACKAELESGVESEISFNQQLTFIARQFILTYEEKFGDLPDPADKVSIKRYAQAALKK
jgi:hypothetical protein